MCSVKTIKKTMGLLVELDNSIRYDFYHSRKLSIDWKQKSSGEQRPEAAIEFPKDLTISSKTRNNLTSDSDNVIWTIARLKDELFIHLTRIKNTNVSNSITNIQCIYLNDKKYYAQAIRLFYWVSIIKPHELIPHFIIYIEDLKVQFKTLSRI